MKTRNFLSFSRMSSGIVTTAQQDVSKNAYFDYDGPTKVRQHVSSHECKGLKLFDSVHRKLPRPANSASDKTLPWNYEHDEVRI